MNLKSLSLVLLAIILLVTPTANAQEGAFYSRTVGLSLLGSLTPVSTLPEVGFGIGAGIFFDYRFNERFSLENEAFFTTQDGSGRSVNENSLRFFAIPATTVKLYILSQSKIEPYIGLGVGIYGLSEGDVTTNDSGGFGLGAHLKAGVEYALADNFMAGLGLTYRSVGIISSLGNNANASTFMPIMISATAGYRF